MKNIFIKPLDCFMCLLIGQLSLVVFCLAAVCSVFSWGRKRKKYSPENSILLFAEAATYSALEKKGNLDTLNNFLCGDFFKKAYFVHFPAPKSQTLRMNDRIFIIEIKPLLKFVKNIGLEFSYTLLNGSWYFFQVFLMKDFTLENVSVIQGAGVHHTALAALLLHFLTKIPVCVSVHSDDEHRYKFMKGYGGQWAIFNSRCITVQLHKFIFTHSPSILLVRPSLQEWALKRGAKKSRISVYPHGIDLDSFYKEYPGNIREEFALLDKKIILFAGRISKENYVLDLPQIAGLVVTFARDALFVIIGDGPERRELEEQVSKMGIRDYFMFLGFLPRHKIYEFRKAADINLCLMAGYGLIEAVLSGKPVITYDVEWHSELIKDGYTGVLVPEHDIKKAADSVIRLTNDPFLAEKLGSNAMKLAMEMYDIRNTSQRKVRIYRELMEAST